MERAVGELAAEDGRDGANSLLLAPHHVPSFLLSDRTESVLQRDPATRGGAATGDAAGEAGEVPPEVRRRSSRTSPGIAETGGTLVAGFQMPTDQATLSLRTVWTAGGSLMLCCSCDLQFVVWLSTNREDRSGDWYFPFQRPNKSNTFSCDFR
ncbi:uncharacterized protein LOC125551962 isoform X2 [Triticum urartu]|uniref:uncharacterized protein LOC125551962 isoform X2 n=1 Tax=Triticum urartu TaxID=4572 RepID=UPI002043021E|nr:uncharacterized protein LOC125551962 isoform X2 [Triticum urartu]